MSDMRNILVIAKREALRLRSRFRGGSSLIVAAMTLFALLLSFFAVQHGTSLNDGIYMMGVSGTAADISDPRFTVLPMERERGLRELDAGRIDVYLDREAYHYRDDDRSLYAVEALSQYLEGRDLRRIARAYDLNRSFPLRVEVRELDARDENLTPATIGMPGPAPTAAPSPGPSLDPGGGIGTVLPVAVTPLAPAGGTGTTDEVADRVDDLEHGSGTSPISLGLIADGDIIIPSLFEPPLPISQILLSFLYVLPLFFISIFFTSSFMEEKVSRRLIVLMSAPVSPADVIAGKLLPYLLLSLAITAALTLLMGGDLLIALAVMVPVTLFIFAIYLLVALFYRTFRDQTFFSMAAIACVTGYLVFPALFSGASDFSFISPLTLIVQMYKGQSFGLEEYLFSAGPMMLVFAAAVILSARSFNEEFLAGYGPLYRKIGDAIYNAVDRRHLYLSIGAASLAAVPLIFMVQLAIIALTSSLPGPLMFGSALLLSVIVEEIGKSAGVAALLGNGVAMSTRRMLLMCGASAIGFLAGEKLLLFMSLSIVSQSALMSAVESADLLIVPLAAHFAFTLVACLIVLAGGARWYFPAVGAASLLHFGYNLYVTGMIG